MIQYLQYCTFFHFGLLWPRKAITCVSLENLQKKYETITDAGCRRRPQQQPPLYEVAAQQQLFIRE